MNFILGNRYCMFDLFWILWTVLLFRDNRFFAGLFCLVGGAIVTTLLRAWLLPKNKS